MARKFHPLLSSFARSLILLQVCMKHAMIKTTTITITIAVAVHMTSRQRLLLHTLRMYYNRLLYSIGIRRDKKRRHEFSVHSFRKYFKTKSEIAGMKPAVVEMLMGHSLGISDSYFKPTE